MNQTNTLKRADLRQHVHLVLPAQAHTLLAIPKTAPTLTISVLYLLSMFIVQWNLLKFFKRIFI